MNTPRATRLVRATDLGGFRAALVSLAVAGQLPRTTPVGEPGPPGWSDPLAARDRLVIVPTRAAAAHLMRTIEDHCLDRAGAVVLPEFATAAELPARFAERLPETPRAAAPAEREVLLGVACRRVAAAGVEPPFGLRAALVAEVLDFYDTLRRHGRDVATFERLALGALEPGAEDDRGAARLVRQTRFLAAAFREFERMGETHALADEHALRQRAVRAAAPRPWRHVIVAVGDRARDMHGLFDADWDLLARVPDLERLDVVTTDGMLAGAFHQRIHDLLPGIEEVRAETVAAPPPRLRVPPAGGITWLARDREEEIAGLARWAREAVRAAQLPTLEAFALVVRQPLPYVYVAREVLRSAGLPAQTFDALPLAAEPYAAAFDLACTLVRSNFARTPAIALLQSPHFRFGVEPEAIAALDRALAESGYLGERDALAAAVARWQGAGIDSRRITAALPAAQRLLALADELAPLRDPQPVGEHLDCLLAFLARYDRVPGPDDALRARQLRARGAVHGIIAALRDAYRAHDPEPAEFAACAGLVRRWIEGHTFAPRAGSTGVHLVDAESARFGEFACVQLAGVVDGEWPDRPPRNIFYSAGILRDLGWPAEAERLDATRAAFVDLLRLPSQTVAVSSFALEHDAVVAGSTLLDEVARAQLHQSPAPPVQTRMFD